MTSSEIAEKIFLKRPALKAILDKYGNYALSDYSKTFHQTEIKVDRYIKAEFINALVGQVKSILGLEAAIRVHAQLEKYYFVSTGDHHGPISHPFFLHANKLAALNHSEVLTDWIVLACSNVSLNNSSYPRGLQFHSKKGESLELKSFSFFPSALRHASIYNLVSYKNSAVEKLASFFVDSKQGETKEIIDIYQSADVLAQKSYSDQITLTNYRVFKKFFPKGSNPLNLIYLNQEELTVKLLEYHYFEDTDIHKLLFDEDYRSLALNLFEGIPGAFSLNESKGTFLFWGYDKKQNKRIRLLEKGGVLSSVDGLVSIPIRPQAIRDALKNGDLIPTMLLNMLVVCGYYGVKCLGGFSQTSYLTWMLDAYKKMFPKATVGDSQTLCSDFIFADITLDNNQAFAATGLDLLLYKDQTDTKKFIELSQTKTLNEVMDRIFPILFKILYPNEQEYSWPKHAYRTDFSIDYAHANPIIKL